MPPPPPNKFATDGGGGGGNNNFIIIQRLMKKHSQSQLVERTFPQFRLLLPVRVARWQKCPWVVLTQLFILLCPGTAIPA
jgi:hypothetical protein